MTATLPSPSTLQPHPAWASLPLFDRKGWKRMAFGAFAESIGERAEPKDVQEEIYVGLEHIDPQCLHIRLWGKGSDVTGTKLRFRKGDIIECVLGRGPNLFYNSPMEACVVEAYRDFKDESGFTRVVPIEEIRAKEVNLSTPLYVDGETQEQTDAASESATTALPDALSAWLKSSSVVRPSLDALLASTKRTLLCRKQWPLFPSRNRCRITLNPLIYQSVAGFSATVGVGYSLRSIFRTLAATPPLIRLYAACWPPGPASASKSSPAGSKTAAAASPASTVGSGWSKA